MKFFKIWLCTFVCLFYSCSLQYATKSLDNEPKYILAVTHAGDTVSLPFSQFKYERYNNYIRFQHPATRSWYFNNWRYSHYNNWWLEPWWFSSQWGFNNWISPRGDNRVLPRVPDRSNTEPKPRFRPKPRINPKSYQSTPRGYNASPRFNSAPRVQSTPNVTPRVNAGRGTKSNNR